MELTFNSMYQTTKQQQQNGPITIYYALQFGSILYGLSGGPTSVHRCIHVHGHTPAPSTRSPGVRRSPRSRSDGGGRRRGSAPLVPSWLPSEPGVHRSPSCSKVHISTL